MEIQCNKTQTIGHPQQCSIIGTICDKNYLRLANFKAVVVFWMIRGVVPSRQRGSCLYRQNLGSGKFCSILFKYIIHIKKIYIYKFPYFIFIKNDEMFI
jgi:hypothetical protein